MKLKQIFKTTEYPNVPWGPLAAIIGTVLIFFGAQFLSIFLISFYAYLRGWSEEQTAAWLNESVGANFAFTVIVFLTSLALLHAFLRKRKASWQDLGLKRPKKVDAGYAVLGYLTYLVAFFVSVYIVQAIAPGVDWQQEQELGFSKQATGLSLVFVFISLVIVPPIMEEILDRGFLYTGLRKRFTIFVSAIVTSIIFAAAHLQWGSEAPLLWAAAIDTFILSLVLVHLREKTGSLASPILVHGIKNMVAFYILFIIKAA